MAIFSLNHSFIGRSKHPPGAASLYARYITRSEVCTVILGRRMPIDGKLNGWLDEQEQTDRKNARVIDKLILALPVELTRDQNIALLEAFGERMTEGRASWMAAIHDGPNDRDNPHAHMIFRDRDVTTGRRVMLTTEPGSTQRFRDAWEQEVNIALERAGREERVDKRSLAAQGIDREPQLHVGAGAEALARKQHEFTSSEKEITRRVDGTLQPVTINYPVIDEGKTRFEENEERKERNRERAEAERLAEGPVRPEGRRLAAMDHAHQAAARAEALYKRRVARPGDAAPEDADPAIWTLIGQHIAERDAIRLGRDSPPQPFARERDEPQGGIGRVPVQARPEPRRGPYPSGPGKERATADDEARRPAVSEHKDSEQTGRRGPSWLIAGAGLALFDRLADSLSSLFEGPKPEESEREARAMEQDKKAQQQAAEQQRREEAEAAHWRRVELQLYLEQRDRERHHDRGR